MNPTFLDSMSWEMAEVYGAITDQILINLSRYFRYYQPGDKIPRTAFEYQAGMLAQMGKVNADTVRIIRNGLQDAPEALKSTLEQAIIDSVSKSEPELLKAVKKGILAPQGVPIVAPEQMKAFQYYYNQSADKLNLVNTVMLESTKSAYQQTISDVVSEIALSDQINATYTALDVAAGEVVTGVSSWNTALRHATDKLKNRGITGFIDHAGRHWSAEAYVAMDIRTTAFNTGRAAIWEENENFGNDLYLVSYHNGARPLCYDWQNKVISSLNNARDVVDLDGNTVHVYAQSETTYGQPAGLFGINCKHYPSPFIPGVSVIRGQPQSPEENEKSYKESQEQRRLERTLREQKRDVLMAKEQGATPEEIKALQNKARETSQEIDDFCEQTGRARHRDREAVYTKREFPEKEKYDVSAFEKKQKDAIETYFTKGGSQQGRTFGMMTPNVPLVPNKPVVPPPTTPVPAVPANVASQATTAPTNTTQSKAGQAMLKSLQTSGIDDRPVTRFATQPTQDDIISRVGGGDRTKGSCASLSWTYAGNKNGLDVLDFRDGKSREFFSRRLNSELIANLDGVVSKIVESGNDLKAVHELQTAMTEGKEYVLITGHHAAVTRKIGEAFEYLELQSPTLGGEYGNGWHTLDDAALRWRFSCKRSHSTYGMKFELKNILIDIDSLNGNAEFEQILGYINTAADKQRKGVAGGLR